MAAGIPDEIFQAALARMNITWDLDPDTEQNISNALEEAQDYLRTYAGNRELSFAEGSYRGLLVDCAWYFLNHQRAEFARVYSDELINLRLMEGFGCGSDG